VKLKITVDNKTYEVEVDAYEPEAASPVGTYVATPGQARVPAVAPPMPQAGAAGSGNVDEAKVCRSPIAGVVVKTPVQAGQQIQPGDVLLVLEAMKMETNITAPSAGKVAKVLVGVGDGVQGGQIVVELE
jgi:methylmalonyl-CoA carboxyltransferase small subunit